MAESAFPETHRIPGYELVRLIGQNMATAYLARRSSTGELVTLKVYAPAVERDHLRISEAPLALLKHPNIIRLVETGEYQGCSYCALEYMDRSLTDRLREGLLPEVEAAKIARAIALAIDYGRGEGVILQRLVPEYILLTDENVPKLFDFRPIHSVGRPAIGGLIPPEFMAPEELNSPTPATDAYRIGALLYTMLTGRPPEVFTERSRLQKLLCIVGGRGSTALQWFEATVSHDLERICVKCLKKRPGSRYTSLRDLANDLERVVRKEN